MAVAPIFAQPAAERDRRLAERLLRTFDGQQAWERYWQDNRRAEAGPASPMTVAFVETPSLAGACFPAREAGGNLHVLSVRPIGKQVSEDDALAAAGAMVGDVRGMSQVLNILRRHVVRLERTGPFGAYPPRQRREGVQSQA